MIEIIWVAFDDARVVHLLQLYLYEWSALLPDRARIGPDALFRYDRNLDRLRAALLVDDHLLPAGFAFVERAGDGTAHVEEFFVLAGLRRRGIGTSAARALFASGPAPWTLTVRPENRAALAFWRRAMPGALERVEVGDDAVARTRLTLPF